MTPQNALHFSNLQEIVDERVFSSLLSEGCLRRLCWTNADLSDLEIVIHRKRFKTYASNLNRQIKSAKIWPRSGLMEHAL